MVVSNTFSISGNHPRCNRATGNMEGIQQNLLLHSILTKELTIMWCNYYDVTSKTCMCTWELMTKTTDWQYTSTVFIRRRTDVTLPFHYYYYYYYYSFMGWNVEVIKLVCIWKSKKLLRLNWEQNSVDTDLHDFSVSNFEKLQRTAFALHSSKETVHLMATACQCMRQSRNNYITS
jgi:hypothetical protein